jgi:hypothetical protein
MEAEKVATTGGYDCRYTPTICDGPVFRWAPAYWPGFEVSASRNGVMFHGPSPCFRESSLVGLLAVVALAERVHRYLSRDDRDTDWCKRVIREAA